MTVAHGIKTHLWNFWFKVKILVCYLGTEQYVLWSCKRSYPAFHVPEFRRVHLFSIPNEFISLKASRFRCVKWLKTKQNTGTAVLF